MDNEAMILLDDLLSCCRRDGRDARLINILEQSVPTSLTEDAFTVQAPNRFALSYLAKQATVLEAYLEEITFAPMAFTAQDPSGQHGAAGGAAAQALRAGAVAPAVAPAVPVAAAAASAAEPAPATEMYAAPATVPAATEAAAAPFGELNARPAAAPTQPAPGDLPSLASTLGNNRPEPVAAPAPKPVTLDERAASVVDAVQAIRAGAGTVAPAAAAPHPAETPGAERGGTGRSDGRITVRNTVSSDAFQRMMAEMKGADAPRTQAATGTAKAAEPTLAPEEEYPAVDVNSKYTFENFVFGDENKHAYQSAVRFTALADEPGQCPSLFIYGNSGLGKTHLLFAIKNYLAKENPRVRVKYANSQAYFEDYLRDLGRRKGPGDPIMREYHDADILIIDDIQNILGKQATIEYFFQLVDEFIRSGKKMAFASDRAPKSLGLDERLTSRFNAGMLCLVSEPGFEMKYNILTRYYENVIRQAADLSSVSSGTSLLSALQVHQGHLTDEQLRHMAEISGNNIRSLESFCERCAGLSSERESEGRELTGEDIDHVAEQYFNTAHKVIHIDTVQGVVEEYYHVSHEELIGPRRTANIAFARHVAVYLANSLCEMTTPAIGAEFGGRDHSTVLNSLKVVENKMKEDRRICEDLQQLKNTIMLKA